MYPIEGKPSEAEREKLLSHRLAWGARGQPLRRTGSNAEKPMAQLSVLAPLIDFQWEGSRFELLPGIDVQETPAFNWDSEVVRHYLSQDERERCQGARHWLAIRQPAQDTISSASRVNAVLIALWVVRPTLTHVAFRFTDSADGLQVARVLERFAWIKDQAHLVVFTADLEMARRLLGPLLSVYAERRRLGNALALTFRGCTARDWQSALICFGSATEAMLTYSRAIDAKEMLAATYAKLASHYGGGAALPTGEFKRLYELRTDVLHGYAYQREVQVRT